MEQDTHITVQAGLDENIFYTLLYTLNKSILLACCVTYSDAWVAAQ